jgi:hypothetical protein
MNSPTKIIPSGVPFVPEGREGEQITESQCVAFLTAKARELKATFGNQHYAVAELGVAFYGSETADPLVTARVSCGGLEAIYSASTFEQAMSEAGDNSPEIRANQKRKQAEALFAEAEALAPSRC